eukprot:5075506-Pleurochrysis_carterae.AAC.1
MQGRYCCTYCTRRYKCKPIGHASQVMRHLRMMQGADSVRGSLYELRLLSLSGARSSQALMSSGLGRRSFWLYNLSPAGPQRQRRANVRHVGGDDQRNTRTPL